MDERQLISAAMAGDREAFTGLVRLHQRSLRALVAMAMLPPDDVSEVVQEALIDAYRHLDRFDPQREFGPWLRTICRNRLQRFLRDRKSRRRHELALVDDAMDHGVVDHEVDAAVGRIAVLRRCLAKLEERHRQVVIMRFHDGLAVKDIAERLRRSANSVSVLLFQLKAALQRCVTMGQRAVVEDNP